MTEKTEKTEKVEKAEKEEKTDIKSLMFAELAGLMSDLGLPSFRAAQIYKWLHEKQVASFQEMTDLPAAMREELEARYDAAVLKQADLRISAIDGTRKYLFALADGNVIESVMMRYRHGNSVCISSQAGCRMGCRFCASTIGGLARNLRASEMLDQVYRIRRDTGERISNVVVMGSGEPLDNYDNTLRFIRLITDERGMNISQRNITVSTCGLVPQILKLAEEKLQITLALSLHAPDDAAREELMPIARRYPLSQVMSACRAYFEKTGRRITFEYSLVKGINDSPGEARKLVRLLRGQHGHVNLIPVNPIRERDFVQPSWEAVAAFKKYLEKNGINVTIRREMGRDIHGACGQLRRSFMEEREK